VFKGAVQADVFKGAVQADVPGAVVGVVEDARGFAALEGEWEELYRDSPAATPFQSWAWLYSWWESYGGGRGLRLVTVRSAGGLLVGVLPLMLERRHGLARLLFVGTGLTPHLDLIAREGWEDWVSEAGARALRQIGGWHVADLQELRPEAAAWALFKSWSGRKSSVWQSQHPTIDATKDWDQLLMSRSKKLRNNARRALRRAEADGVEYELASREEVEAAARRLVTMSRERWRDNPLTGAEHWTPRFESHLKTSACRMAARGWGGISEWRKDGEVIFSEFLVFGPGYVGAYMVGISPEAFRLYEVSALTAHAEVNIARHWDAPYVSLGRGQDTYKLRWSSALVPNYRLIVGRNPLFWSVYAGYHVLRSALKRYAHSPDSPRWVKSIPHIRYRTLRDAASRFVRHVVWRKAG
jgi:hypothetical protein